MSILLFTDFGTNDLYAGQVKAMLHHYAPNTHQVDLLHNAPAFNLKASAHLLAALFRQFALGSIFLAVVDPGVGGDRDAVVVLADGKWLIGPDNGLLSVAASRSASARYWRITWRPGQLSHSFHGRDLFAPVAAMIARGELPDDRVESIPSLQSSFGPDDLPEIIYLDHYGNALTGIRAANLLRSGRVRVNGHVLNHARVFSEVPEGEVFWYENSVGLTEFAVNCGSAASFLGLEIGHRVEVLPRGADAAGSRA